MQKPSSPVSSGNISPTIVGPSKDTKEVYVIVIDMGILGLAVVIGIFWYFSGQGQSYATKAPAETLTNTQVANVLKTGTTPLAEPVEHSQTIPAPIIKSDSIHTDTYFEVGRKGLTDNARRSSPRRPT